jgi:hypothetical protein
MRRADFCRRREALFRKSGAHRSKHRLTLRLAHLSADETTDVGRDTGTPVSSDYTRKTSEFNGKVNWVQIDLGKDVHDHFISPEERLNLAMARQ